MTAILYKERKKITQSGHKKISSWILEYKSDGLFLEPVMSWTGNKNTMNQVRIAFSSQDAAIEYAKANNIIIEEVIEPKPTNHDLGKSYVDNFK